MLTSLLNTFPVFIINYANILSLLPLVLWWCQVKLFCCHLSLRPVWAREHC